MVVSTIVRYVHPELQKSDKKCLTNIYMKYSGLFINGKNAFLNLILVHFLLSDRFDDPVLDRPLLSRLSASPFWLLLLLLE